MKVSKKTKNNESNSKKIIIIAVVIVIIVLLILIVGSLFFGNLTDSSEVKNSSVKNEEKIGVDEYNYKLNENATEYEKTLFKELELVLSEEIVDDEKYATILSKLFVTDLFTLNNKKGSSDVTSIQYVYADYQEKYKTLVMDTLYSTIELNFDGKKTQKLPVVKEVVVSNIERESFSLNDEVIDEEAFKVILEINYEENLEYPTNYGVIMVKKDKLLQVVKSWEV